MKKVQQGFTLIELMIVVAIVGILAAIALPAYQDYIVRSKMTEPVAALDAAKLAVSEFASTSPELLGTADAAVVGITSPTNGKYLDSITYTPSATAPTLVATIKGTGLDTVDGQTITLTGTVNSGDGTIAWACSTNATFKYVPANCRNT